MKQKTRIEKDKEANNPLVEDKYAHNEKSVNVQRKLRPNIDPRNSIGLTSISEMKGISDIKGIRDIVNPYRSTPVQIHPRLTISQPNDQAEVEADRVAKSVASPLCPADISPRSGESSISGNTGLQVGGELASEITGLSGGAALSSDQQVFFGEKLGTDFSNVKIHNGSKAHDMAEALNAEAFTFGNNIVFNEGKFQPGTSNGKELLAHELVHVRQQEGGVKRKENSQDQSNQKDYYIVNIDNKSEGGEPAGIFQFYYEADNKEIFKDHKKWQYNITFYQRDEKQWDTFLDTCAYKSEKSDELNVFMAAALGQPELSFTPDMKYWAYLDILPTGKYYGFKYIVNPSMAKMKTSAIALIRAMLLSKTMDLHGEISPISSNNVKAAGVIPKLLPLFIDKYLYSILDNMKTEDIKKINVTNFAKETQVSSAYKLLIKGSLVSVGKLLEESVHIPVKDSEKTIVSALDNRIYEFGRLAGKGIKVLIDRELGIVDYIGDVLASVLSLALPVVPSIVCSLVIDWITDNYKPSSHLEVTDKTQKEIETVVKKILKSIGKIKDETTRVGIEYRLLMLLKSYLLGISRII